MSSSTFRGRGSRLLRRHWLTFWAVLVLSAVASFGASPAQASIAVATGPVVPTASEPFDGMAWTSDEGNSGQEGGTSWTFTSWHPEIYPYLAWGPAGADKVQFAFDGTIDNPGETLAFSSDESDRSAGRLRWLGSATMWWVEDGYPQSATFETRFTLQVSDLAGAPLGLVNPADLPADGFMATLPPAVGDVGGILLVNRLTPGAAEFKAGLLFEVDTDLDPAGQTWAPAVDFYNSRNTNPSVSTVSHFTAGFYYPLAGQATVTPSLFFGNVEVGTERTLTATVTSSGFGPLYLNGFEVDESSDSGFGLGDMSGTGQWCHYTTILGPNESCDIAVTLAPTLPRAESGRLLISTNATGSPHVVMLTGTGTQAIVGFDPAIGEGLWFGDVTLGSSKDLQLTVGNTGSASLRFLESPAFSSGDYAITAMGDGCEVSEFLPGATCTVTITFSPQSAGPLNGTLTFIDNAVGSPHVYPLWGTGVVPKADVSVSVGATPVAAKVKKPLTYTIAVQNAGPFEARSVVLTDVLPSTVEFSSVTVTQGTAACTAPLPGQTGAVVCHLGTLGAGSLPVVVSVATTVGSGGGSSISNTAEVSASTLDPLSVNNSATVVNSVYGRR
jgi:uncharacterized repeat protein (TIGR01451 family)